MERTEGKGGFFVPLVSFIQSGLSKISLADERKRSISMSSEGCKNEETSL